MRTIIGDAAAPRRPRRGVAVDGPSAADRPRLWKLTPTCRLEVGQPVALLGYPVLADGEDLTEQVPQRHLSWADWLESHADYGLAVDGSRLEA
jgi:hypothetical protein